MKHVIFTLFCLQIGSYAAFASEAPVKKTSPVKVFFSALPTAYCTHAIFVDGIDALKNKPIQLNKNLIKNLYSAKRAFFATKLSLGVTLLYSAHNRMEELNERIKKIKLD